MTCSFPACSRIHPPPIQVLCSTNLFYFGIYWIPSFLLWKIHQCNPPQNCLHHALSFTALTEWSGLMIVWFCLSHVVSRCLELVIWHSSNRFAYINLFNFYNTLWGDIIALISQETKAKEVKWFAELVHLKRMDLVPDSMPLATSKYKNDSNKSKVVFHCEAVCFWWW